VFALGAPINFSNARYLVGKLLDAIAASALPSSPAAIGAWELEGAARISSDVGESA
jgi:hypothetical protein